MFPQRLVVPSSSPSAITSSKLQVLHNRFEGTLQITTLYSLLLSFPMATERNTDICDNLHLWRRVLHLNQLASNSAPLSTIRLGNPITSLHFDHKETTFHSFPLNWAFEREHAMTRALLLRLVQQRSRLHLRRDPLPLVVVLGVAARFRAGHLAGVLACHGLVSGQRLGRMLREQAHWIVRDTNNTDATVSVPASLDESTRRKNLCRSFRLIL